MDVVGDASLEALDTALVRFVRAATHPRIAEQLNEWAGLNLERSGYALLHRVEEHPGAHLADLAEAAVIDSSTASRQIGRLVDAGLVARSTDPADHRAHRHHLTEDGVATLDRVRAARSEWLAAMVADLDREELTSLGRLLTNLSERLRSMPMPAPPDRGVGSSAPGTPRDDGDQPRSTSVVSSRANSGSS